jgi:gluconolactonase
MKICLATAVLACCLLASAAPAEFEIKNPTEFRKIVPEGAHLVKLAGGMKFAEGPVWIPANDGALVFSDLFNSELKRWTRMSGLTSYRQPAQKVAEFYPYNGNTVDREGRLLTCGHSERRITRTEKDGSIVTLLERASGKKLNSPNDVVVKSDGMIYFTDPDYGIKPDQKEQPGNYVYRLNPKTGDLIPLVKDFVQPNGLCFTADEKKLYVADSSFEKHHIRVFDVQSDGTLANGRLFCTIAEGLPDGIRCDVEGHFYSSSQTGIQIFGTDGNLIGKILVPEKATANLAFGESDYKTVYITATTSLYSMQLAVAGAR